MCMAVKAIRPLWRTGAALLVTFVLAGCNILAAPDQEPPGASPRSPTSDVTPARIAPTAAVTAPQTPTPTPEPPSPTPTPTPTPTPQAPAVDLSSFPYVHRMGRLSLSQGWVLMDSFGSCGANLSCRARLMLTEGLDPTDKLLWTEDAGDSWSEITPEGLSNCPAPDICGIVSRPVFLDPSRVRIVVLRGQELEPPTTLSLMYTEDGGMTWGLWHIDEISSGLICPGHGCLSEVDLEFSDPRNGWLSANASLGMGTEAIYLYRTRDGGQSWTALVKTWTGDSGGPGWVPTPIVHQLEFIDASTGWAASGWRYDTGTMLVTQDGGSSWEPMSLNVPEAYAEMGRDHYDPVFFSHDSGLLLVRFYRREGGEQLLGFYTTGNAGETWSLAATLEDPDLRAFYGGDNIPWSAIDEATWFVAVSEARQYLTRDRGRTWEVFAAEGLVGFGLTEVQFVSEMEGWGLGKICERDLGCANSMFATHDGGHTWVPIRFGP